MSIGLGILLIVIGAIVEWVVKVSIPGIDQGLLGWILMGAGLAVVILSLLFGALRGRTRVTTTTRDAAGNQQVSTQRAQTGDHFE